MYVQRKEAEAGRGGSRAAATSKMECFVIIVNGVPFEPRSYKVNLISNMILVTYKISPYTELTFTCSEFLIETLKKV